MKPITPHSVYDLLFLDDVQISPDGSSVVFTRQTADRETEGYKRNIWIKPLKSEAPAEPFTTGSKDSHPRWSADGSRLGFISGRADKPQMYVIPLAGGEAHAVTKQKTGVAGFAWSPDGSRIAFTSATRPDERADEDRKLGAPADAEGADDKDPFMVKQEKEKREHLERQRFDPRAIRRVPYRTGTTFIDDAWTQLYVQGVPAGFGDELPKPAPAFRLTDADDNFGVPDWSKDGNSLLSTFTRQIGGPRWYLYADVIRIPVTADPAARTFTRLTGEGFSCNNPELSPDGKWIAFLRTKEDRPGHRVVTLAIMPAEGGEPVDLTAPLDRGVEAFKWSRDTQYLYFTLAKDGNINLWRVDLPIELSLAGELSRINIPTGIRGRLIDDLGFSPRVTRSLKRMGVQTTGELTDWLSHAGPGSGAPGSASYNLNIEQLTALTQDVGSFDVDAAGRIVFVASTPGDPCALYAREVDGVVRVLYKPNRKFLELHDVGEVERISYPSDDFTIEGWIIKPPNFEPGRKYPLALEIHGGPHVQWTPSCVSMFHEWQMLAHAGYVVFFCNPRGADGYGEAYTSANRGDWGPGPQRDVLRGVDEVVKRGYIDTDRMAITGGSYGGYLTAWIIGQDHRFKAAVAQRGVYNLISMRGTTDIPLFNDFESGATPWDDVQGLWRQSPVAYAPDIQTPLLIEHSELDFRVPIEQGEQLFQALQLLKKPVEMVRWPREGHELSRSGEPKHRIKRLALMLEWFDRYTQSNKSTGPAQTSQGAA